MEDKNVTLSEQEILLKPLSRRTTYQKKKTLLKKRKFWIMLIIMLVIGMFIAYFTFLNDIFSSNNKEKIIYNKDGVTVSFQHNNGQQFSITVNNERQEQVHVGITNLVVDGKEMTFEAHKSNPSYSELSKLNINMEDTNELIKSSYLVQDELGILYIDPAKAMDNGDKHSVQYEEKETSKIVSNSKNDLSFILMIYTISSSTENMIPYGFAAVDEKYRFLYLKEQASVKVQGK